MTTGTKSFSLQTKTPSLLTKFSGLNAKYTPSY